MSIVSVPPGRSGCPRVVFEPTSQRVAVNAVSGDQLAVHTGSIAPRVDRAAGPGVGRPSRLSRVGGPVTVDRERPGARADGRADEPGAVGGRLGAGPETVDDAVEVLGVGVREDGRAGRVGPNGSGGVSAGGVSSSNRSPPSAASTRSHSVSASSSSE
jgi:hypothetical protein